MSVKLGARFLSALLLIAFCFTGPVLKAPKQTFPGMAMAVAQSEGSFKLRVDVELVTVEVAAFDKKGKPVRDLKKEDFKLYEDGKSQEILSFDEVNAESPASALGVSAINEGSLRRGKTVLILFIDSAIAPRFVKQSRDSAYKFVKEHMGPQDLFAVGSYVSSMKIIQNLTSDRDEVLAAIEKSANMNASGMVYFDDLLRSLQQINLSIARIKGQKSIFMYAAAALGATPSTRTPYNDTLTSAKKANVVYYTVDPNVEYSGSSPAMSFGGPSVGARASGGISEVSLMGLASQSGGTAVFNTTTPNNELDKLDQQLSNYYVLGFQSNNPLHDGAFRKLEVRTEAKGVTLKYRTGYQDRSPVDVLASSKQEKTLMTALDSPDAAQQLPLVFRPAYFYDSAQAARVLVAARIRMEKMVFKKKGGQLGADLNIMGVAYAEDGRTAARFSETLPVSFDKEKEAEFRKGNLAYRNYFRLRPGKYRLKLAVSDESNNIGSTEQAFEVPPLPEQALAGSSLVVAEGMSRLPELVQNLQNQMLEQSDPLLYSGMQIEPRVENRLPVNSAIPVIFRVYNLPGQPDQWDFAAKAKLLDEKGREFALPPISLKKVMSPAGKAEAVVALRLPFQDVPPGKYTLVIETTDAAATNATTFRTDLEFIK
jgi:VWFA-related protein